MGMKGKIKELYLRFTTFKWIVGVADYDEDAILTPKSKLNIHWIKYKNKEGWFADPFILSVTDDFVYLLVEELFYSNNKGRISRLKIDRNTWKLLQVEPVIELPTHLSFPVYFRENGKVYIYPESTKTGKLSLYEYDESTGTAVPVRDLCQSPLADAVIWDINGRKVIAATTSPNDNGKVLDIYPCCEKSETDREGPVEQIVFSDRIARNAGMPFEIKGRWFRPAQNCARRYGECVIIQEIINSAGKFQFKEVKRFHSPLSSHQVAFHTFNVFETQYIAVDAEGMRYGRLAEIVYKMRERLRK